MKWLQVPTIALIVQFLLLQQEAACGLRHYSKKRMLELREEVRAMFQHAYEGYLQHAADYDELRPLTCDGVDTWGSYSLTLIDALDTLATMGNFSEFRRVAVLLEKKMNFDKDINVSVFETNIRIVGGLLSAHLLSKRAGLKLEAGWPCQGPLLRMAEDVARRLLPAFDTTTGMPYGTVNLRYGVPKAETTVSCTAGVGTFLVEFGALSRLTGNSIYEDVALNAVYAVWERRSQIGLLGNHIDVQSGRWTALDSGIGAGVDSFFEYLVKGAIMLNRPNLLEMFHEARQAIDKYLKRDDWYIWASMNKGQITIPVFQSLEAFWPGVLSLIGDTAPAMRTLSKYSSVWRKYGFLPEFYNIVAAEASPNRESYPLRPELAESTMYLYRATKNQFLLQLGEDMLHSIEFSARTKCGYATIRNVVNHEKDNRMESFFLSETTKYLYLLFDEDNFLHNDGAHGERHDMSNGSCIVHAGAHIFNTEAHPIDMSALYCCHDMQQDIYDGLDLEQFQDSVLLQAERESHAAKSDETLQQQCAAEGVKQNKQQQKKKAAQTQQSEQQITVDIEVLDENNNPAGEVLIENFIRVKSELRANSAADTNEQHELKGSQVTILDLETFFETQPEQFNSAEHVLNYVMAFMENYTLDATYIKGLNVFEKNSTASLGAAAQKEFEEHTRTLWNLYVLQQQQLENAKLVTQLGVGNYLEEDRAQLKRVLQALDIITAAETTAAPVNLEEEMPEDIRKIYQALNLSLRFYQLSLVNTTAMQQFLMRILINGSTEKQRHITLLLQDNKITSLLTTSATNLDANEKYKFFKHLRRMIELKERMIETFEDLQNLLLTKDTPPTTTETSSNDELIVATDKSEKASEAPANKENNKLDLKEINAKDDNDSSVWSQLVQTILRKTTLQRAKFDEAALRRKTQIALQNYADNPMKYELFTCERPKFYEKFAYREFYP